MQHAARLSTSSRRLSQSDSVIIKYFMVSRISFLVRILGFTVFGGKRKSHAKHRQRNREQEGCKWNSKDMAGVAWTQFPFIRKTAATKSRLQPSHSFPYLFLSLPFCLIEGANHFLVKPIL